MDVWCVCTHNYANKIGDCLKSSTISHNSHFKENEKITGAPKAAPVCI